MKGMWFDAQGYHLFVRDLDTLLVSIGVKLTGDGEAGLGCGAGDQLDDGQVADQRLGAPVHADDGKQLVLDAVPFTGAGWQMVHGNRDPDVIGLPPTRPHQAYSGFLDGRPRPVWRWLSLDPPDQTDPSRKP